VRLTGGTDEAKVPIGNKMQEGEGDKFGFGIALGQTQIREGKPV